jgi:hypothetical protein
VPVGDDMKKDVRRATHAVCSLVAEINRIARQTKGQRVLVDALLAIRAAEVSLKLALSRMK